MRVARPNGNAEPGGRTRRFAPAGRALLLLGLLLLVSALHFLPPGRPADEPQIHLTARIIYSYDVDSGHFAWTVAAFPGGMATELGKARRSRPLYSALGWAMHRGIFQRLERSLPPALYRLDARLARQVGWSGESEGALLCIWLALIATNLLSYWAALLLLDRVLRQFFPPAVALALAFVPIVHFNTIDFALVPHSEPFNVLIPALFLWGAASLAKGGPALAPAGLLGIGMLGKAMPYLVLNWVATSLARWRRREPRALLALVGAGLIVLPGLLYLLLLLTWGVQPYSMELDVYRQGLWITDAIRQGRSLAIPAGLVAGLGTHLLQLVSGFSVPLLAIAGLWLASRRRREHGAAPFALPHPMVGQLAVYGIACTVFWVWLGYFEERLTLTHYPWVVFLLGYLAMRGTRRPAAWICTALALNVLAWMVGLHGA